MNELMVHVERAVRPVRARPARKLKMRQELLAHLTGIYDEELARRGDPAAALAEARHRFGDPAALTRELQDSVPAAERVLSARVPGVNRLAAIQRLCARRPGESEAHYRVRSAVWQGVLLTSLALLTAVARAAGSGWTLDSSELRVMAGCLAVLAVVNSTFMYLVAAMGRAVSDDLGPTALARAVAYGAAALVVTTASAPVSLRLLLGTGPYPPNVVERGAVVTTVVLVGLAALLRFDAVKKRRQAEWTALEISE
jgi:hypothetical protein